MATKLGWVRLGTEVSSKLPYSCHLPSAIFASVLGVCFFYTTICSLIILCGILTDGGTYRGMCRVEYPPTQIFLACVAIVSPLLIISASLDGQDAGFTTASAIIVARCSVRGSKDPSSVSDILGSWVGHT